ncbi:MAG TPA: His/Gly/Thr/Pro-type tRNA ligase C-terminal domain-containing protein, partial [Candidatus Melainabacteria bacterium]|nr:His/Gly/Thr/Pro-type tRNA ligase C-terminal domain-containing protein [Candidatus Melainabacteria bacterium]
SYSEALGATVLDEEGSKTALVMGSYGIGVERVLAASVEISHDEKGIIWPLAIAPYTVLITPVNMGDEAIAGAAEEIYSRLKSSGFDVLLDDRPLRAGVKFNDGDLIGIPIRITVGKKIASQEVEILERSTNSSTLVSMAELIEQLEERMGLVR